MMNINNESYFIKQKITLPLVFIFLVLVSLAAYFNSLHNDFIFEDSLLIAENPYIKDFRFIGRIFKTDIFHFHPNEPGGFNKYYRPLQSLSYSLDYFLWKLNPAGFRLTNILIHGANGFLFFLLIALIFKDNILALLSALIFCLHPIHVLNVACLSPRSSLLETLFMFSSLVAFFRYYLYKQRFYYPLSLLLFILAVLSREAALLLPLFIVTCAFSLNSMDKKKMTLSLLPYFILAAFYLLLRSRFMPCEKLNITAANLWQKLTVFLWLLQKYLTQLLLPIGLQVSLFGQRLTYAFYYFCYHPWFWYIP